MSVSELLDLIGQDYLSALSQELQSDKWMIKLKTKSVFNLLIYSLLESNRDSLRDMEADYSSALFQAIEHLAVETSLKEVIQEAQHGKRDLIVFDRGLKSRETFKKFSDKDTQFVTRLNANARYQTLRQHQPLPTVEHDETRVLKDEIVYLYGTLVISLLNKSLDLSK